MSRPLPAAAGCSLACRVVPRASRTECAGLYGERLKIRLQAPPVDGKANKALLKFLAAKLAVPARALTLTAGETSRDKTVHIAGLSPDTVRQRLAAKGTGSNMCLSHCAARDVSAATRQGTSSRP